MADPVVNRRERLAAEARRSTLIGVLVNGSLALFKGTAGILGNSFALIADAIESFSDVISSVVVWVGLRVAAAPLSEKHPYGKGRAETFAAVLVAAALFIAAGGIAVNSVEQIRHPGRVPETFTLAVLVAVVLVKEGMYRFTRRVGDKVGSAAVKGDALHHRSDAVTSLAAFVGISVAIVGGPRFASADAWAALFAAGVIGFNAWNLLSSAFKEMLDRSPNKALAESIREVAARVEGVTGTHKCFVRKVGFDYFVDLDVLVDGEMTVTAGHDIAHAVQDAVREELPYITRVLVHVEPDDQYGRRPLFG